MNNINCQIEGISLIITVQNRSRSERTRSYLLHVKSTNFLPPNRIPRKEKTNSHTSQKKKTNSRITV